MIYFRKAKRIWYTTIIFYLIYNTYFGWNWEPINEAEKICDSIANVLVIVSALYYLTPATVAYRAFIETLEEE